MAVITGVCPKTNKKETIQFKMIDTTINGKADCIPGLLESCTAIKGGENLCHNCCLHPLNNTK